MKCLRSIGGWLALVLAGWHCVQPASAAPLPNAWQITDFPPAAGATYSTNLGGTLPAQALTNGWRFSVNARMADDFNGTATMVFLYGVGTNRFSIYWDLDPQNNLVATPFGQPPVLLTMGGTGAALYHTHEITYNPTNQRATYLFDGMAKTIWAGDNLPEIGGRIAWGSTPAAAGLGRMNFHAVRFLIGSNEVAAYDAGTAGNPPNAPNPTTQGWTVTPPVGAGTNAISPDTALLPVAVTLAADQLISTSARLNGQVNPSGSPTFAWFEWGTDTSYGNTTGAQNVPPMIPPVARSAVIGGLAGGQEYHYRQVASNTFGVVMGTDQSFNLSFIQTAIPGLPGVLSSSVAWGDYDGDGRLDFLFTGDAGSTDVSQLWRNTGSGFSNVTASVAPGLPGVYQSSVAWGDYDGDGRLDFLLTGDAGSTNASQLWRNTGSGFSNVTPAVAPGLPGVVGGAVAWSDYDNDGRLDYLLTGHNGSTGISQLWRNTGSGFSNVTAAAVAGLPALAGSSVAWGDFDNDGRQDFLLTGYADSAGLLQLWRNTGSGLSNVTAVVAPGAPGLRVGSVAWGDYDNDGRLDFLATGTTTGSTGESQLWQNTRSGFSNVTASVAPGLPGVYQSSVAWADYDNDGRLDFLLTGFSSTGSVSQVWRNTGSGFSNVTAGVAPGLPGVVSSSVAWGDYDNDGRLDFLLTGFSSTGRVSQLWRNNLPIPGPPTAIVSLTVTNNAGGGTHYQSLIRNEGSLLAAVNLGHSGPDLTRNGVTFVSTTGGNPSGPNWSAAGPNTDDGLGYPGIDDLFFSEVWGPSPCTLTYSNLDAGRRYLIQILHGEPRGFFATTFRNNTLATSRNVAAPVPAFALGNNVPGQNPPASNDVAIITAELQGTTFFKYTCRNTPARGSSIAGFQVRDITALIVRPRIFQPVLQGSGQFAFSFSNQTVVTYQVLGTTNVSLPVTQWQVLGLPASLGGGLYQFTDTLAPNHAQRFYLLRAP